MRQRRSSIRPLLLLCLVLAVCAGIGFRQGVIPARYLFLPRVDLDNPTGWFLDWRLAALKNDREICQSVLKPPHIEAAAVADAPLRAGCGWRNSVRLGSAGGARVSLDKLTCETAAALALWMAHEVQPLARSFFGQPVASVQHLGGYACRNIVGNPFWKDMRSEHATANAIDISGFTLADGRTISVLKNWGGGGPEAAFLRAVHDRACRYFRVAIGPEFNVSHRDHFHLDRGILSRCR